MVIFGHQAGRLGKMQLDVMSNYTSLITKTVIMVVQV